MGLLKIKSFQLVNIQSWGDKSPVINLGEDKNIIIANSETGKSVLFKILKQMCFNNQWGYNNADLIRQGCSKGFAVFDLCDGNRVIFELFPTTQNYYLFYVDSDSSKRRKDFIMGSKAVEIPEEVADAMGFLLDRKSKTIINVLDRDMQMPLVTTNPATSGRILSAVTENPELETMMETAKEWLTEAKEKRASVYTDYVNAKDKYDSVEYKNLQPTQTLIALLKSMRTLGGAFNNAEVVGRDLKRILATKPKYNKAFNYVSFLTSIKDLASVCDYAKTLRETLESKPKDFELGEGDLEILELFKEVQEVQAKGQALQSQLEKRPEKVEFPLELQESGKFLKECGLNLIKQGEDLKEVYKTKPTVVKFPSFLMFSRSMLELDLDKSGASLKELLRQGKALREQQEETAKKLEELKKTVKVCPLCLRPYEEESK